MAGRDGRVSGSFLTALSVLVALFALMIARATPPGPRAAGAAADEFSAGRAREILSGLVGDGTPHPVGSDANARVRERIVAELVRLGYDATVQTTIGCGSNTCASVANVVARLDGRERTRAVLLATHYDSVQAGPGASDAGASVAAVVEIARILKAGSRPRNPVIFLIDDGEEAGLLGAEAFVREHPWARDVGATVNLEARGTSGQSVMFETSRNNGWLIGHLARSLKRPSASSLFYPIYERLPNDTDLTVFKAAGMTGVNFAYIGDVVRYHTMLDNVDHASAASLQHQGDNALAIVRALAEADLSAPPSGDVVFFDVLGLGIVRWPRSLTVALAVVAFVLVLVAAVGIGRSGLSIWRMLLGFAQWILMIGLSAAAAWGLLSLLTRLGAFPGDATTKPTLTVGAFWLTGFGVATAVAFVFGRWSRHAGAWIGCWVGWAIAGVAAALYAAEASYIFVVPALVAGLVGAVSVVASRARPGAFASLAPLVTVGLLWMGPAWFLFDALGPPMLPVIAGAVAVMSTALGPFATAVGVRSTWVAPLFAVVAACGLAALSLTAPAFSAERPERMNITFVQNADPSGAPAARWLVAPQSRVLPAAIRDVRTFGTTLSRAFPWSGSASVFAADADTVDVSAPVFELVANDRRETGRVVEARLLSPRGARVVVLMLPATRISSIAFAGKPLSGRAGSARQRVGQRGAPGLTPFAFLTLPSEGVAVTISVTGETPVEGYLYDQTPGLPPGGAALVRARPTEATPSDGGDRTIVARRLAF